ncbi:uncharacterized protein ACNS7B_008083 [Menidia menidia]
MKNFLTNIPLNQVSIFVSIIVSFTYNVLLDRDVACTCEGDGLNCFLYMGLPFIIIFFLIVWTENTFFSTFNYLCGCKCSDSSSNNPTDNSSNGSSSGSSNNPTDNSSGCLSCCCSTKSRQFRWIVAVSIFKAGLVGGLWVVSVLIDGDWYICCQNNFSDQQKHLACKKNNITAQEKVEISKLKNKSINIGFGLMLGILFIAILMSLSCWRKCCDKDSLYRQLIAEEGESMLNETMISKLKEKLGHEIEREIQAGQFKECFDFDLINLIDFAPTRRCPEAELPGSADKEEQSQVPTEPKPAALHSLSMMCCGGRCMMGVPPRSVSACFCSPLNRMKLFAVPVKGTITGFGTFSTSVPCLEVDPFITGSFY